MYLAHLEKVTFSPKNTYQHLTSKMETCAWFQQVGVISMKGQQFVHMRMLYMSQSTTAAVCLVRNFHNKIKQTIP